MQSEIDQERWQDEARRQGPSHDLPNHREIGGHYFFSPSAVASVCTMESISAK